MNRPEAVKQLFVIILILVCVLASSLAAAFDEIQITFNDADDRYVDMAIDPDGNIHLVYERDSKIYHRTVSASEPTGTEELIDVGIDSAMAFGPTGDLHVVYKKSSDLMYTVRTLAGWKAPENTGYRPWVPSDCDIAVDRNNIAHVVFQGVSIEDTDFESIFYGTNHGGSFVEPSTILYGSFSGWGCCYYRLGYYNPSIVIDKYDIAHVVAEHLDWAWDDGDERSIFHITYDKIPNGGGAGVARTTNTPVLIGNYPITLSSSGLPFVAYNDDQGIHVKRLHSDNSWELLFSETGRNEALAVNPVDDQPAIVFVDDSTVYYTDDYWNRISVAQGRGPVIAIGSKTYIAYVREVEGNLEVFLASAFIEKAPLIKSIPDSFAIAGIPYTGPTPMLSRGSSPIEWSLVSGPPRLVIDKDTGIVSWSDPSLSDSPYTIIIKATNPLGYDEEKWHLTVKNPNIPPSVFELLLDED